MHSPKNKKNGHEKQKQNLNIYKDMVPNPTIKIRKRERGCLHKGLELFKSTKVIDMF